MSASWDSDLSTIIEKTNKNLKLLRKIGDNSPSDMSLAGSSASTRPRVYVGAQDDVGSSSSHTSARPRVFIRGDDDNSSIGSHTSARPKAFVRNEDDAGSIGSYSSAARPRVYVGDDGTGSVSSHSSLRPKAFLRVDDDTGSVSSRASARPKAFIRTDDDTGSVSSRASARPKAFLRTDDDTGSVSSRASARPKAYIRRDDDSSSMSSNQGLNRSRLDSGASTGRPHVGIAGGGGLTAAMLQQHRATTGTGIGGLDLGASRARYDLDETRSMTGMSARIRRPLGSNGRAPLAQSLSASVGPRIRVPESDIPSDIPPSHVIDDVKKSLETQFASRNAAMDRKLADLRTDFTGLSTQMSSLSSQVSELRDAVGLGSSAHAKSATIARLEEQNADLLTRQASVDREVAELSHRVKFLSSASTKISTLEDTMESLVASRQKQEQPMVNLIEKVQMMQRQMDSFVDMTSVENVVNGRLSREFRDMEDRMAMTLTRMMDKMEQRVQTLEKQSRQDSLLTVRNDLSDEIQRLQSSMLRKSDLLPVQNAQMQSKEEMVQLSSALDRQERKLQDTKVASVSLREELVDTRTELTKALQSQQRTVTAVMEDKLEEIVTRSKEKASKVDDQLSKLAKKQKKLEETIEMLQEKMALVKVDASRRFSHSSLDRKEENEKLRQRLARSVAEMEALATAKDEVERRHVLEQQHFQSRLDDLRTTLAETEKQKEVQRLELVQRLQEESKLMGVAQGQNSMLETLLAREKAANEEKNNLVRSSKKKMAEVRDQIRSLESAKETKIRRLTSELQAKQTQVKLLTQTLERVETATATMLALSKREAQTVRRVKATKEHELFLAQLKLKEMERVAQKSDGIKEQAVVTAASTQERHDLEKLLLESQLEKEELKQELEDMTEALTATKESQKVSMETIITKLSSEYDEKVNELKQQIADREQVLQHLRETLVEKSELNALDDELSALKNEKSDLLALIQRAQSEHEQVMQETALNVRLEQATELATLKSKFQERMLDLESAKSELETTKASIAELEKELEKVEGLHQRQVSVLTHEIQDARGKMDECIAQIVELKEVKARLEGEISQKETISCSEKEELRMKLAEVSSTLAEKEKMLVEAKESDETNRERLVGLAMTQEELQLRFVSQIDSLAFKLHQERESSRSRELDLENAIAMLKSESSKEVDAACGNLTDEISELVAALEASKHRENHLKLHLERILKALLPSTNASSENVTKDADVDAITHHFDALYATHRRTAHELDRLQLEYELTAKQAAVDSATAQELANQVQCHQLQINSLEAVVEQLREQLKEQYHKYAIVAKGSAGFEGQMAAIDEEKRQLESQLQQLQHVEVDEAKREPKSQDFNVDSAAMALALEKAQSDYFSESSETGLDEDLDGEQPDVEQESVSAYEEGEGATFSVEEEHLSGEMCHEEVGICADVEDAEHFMRDEQEQSHERVEEDEEDGSNGETKDAVESWEDRKEKEVESRIGMETATRTRLEDDALDNELETGERLLQSLVVQSTGSKQRKPRIDNECDNSVDFPTEQSAVVGHTVGNEAACESEREVFGTNGTLTTVGWSDSEHEWRGEKRTADWNLEEKSSSLERAERDDVRVEACSLDVSVAGHPKDEEIGVEDLALSDVEDFSSSAERDMQWNQQLIRGGGANMTSGSLYDHDTAVELLLSDFEESSSSAESDGRWDQKEEKKEGNVSTLSLANRVLGDVEKSTSVRSKVYEENDVLSKSCEEEENEDEGSDVSDASEDVEIGDMSIPLDENEAMGRSTLDEHKSDPGEGISPRTFRS